MKESKHIQEPEHHYDDDDGVQDRLDAARHGDETIHQPQQNANYDQDHHKVNQGHDLSSFFALRHPASLVVDPCCRFGPRADATLWSGVEPGISGWFRLKLRYCFSLQSFCFPHEQHTRRDGGGYLFICGHICHLLAHVRPAANAWHKSWQSQHHCEDTRRARISLLTLRAFWTPRAWREKLSGFPRGQLSLHKDAAKHVMYIQQGSVKFSVVNATGKEAVVAVLKPGAFLANDVLQASRFAWGQPPVRRRPPRS
jgi:hypothetical protein